MTDADFVPPGRNARRALGATIIALTAVSIGYRILVGHRLEHTSLVFIGIPALLAFMLVSVRPATAVGTINKVIALALCMSGILFGEALVCILFAAPIFFLVGTLVGVVVNALRGDRGNDRPPSVRWRAAVAAMVVPMSLEGVVPHFEFERDAHVTVSQVVPASVAAVRASLAAPPRFDRPLPAFFRLGFPTPAHASGTGLEPGDLRTITFAHGQHHPGTLTMAVTASDTAHVEFTAVSDDSYVTHWLRWDRAIVRLERIDAARTRVRWTLRYRRRLDPAWYFEPLQRYGATLAAEYLIETLATPRTAAALP